VKGVWRRIDDNTLEITELPIRVWTQTYKEFLEKCLLPSGKSETPLIQSYKEYHTDTMVHFVIKCDKLKEMSDAEVISYPKIIHMFSSHIPSLSLLRIILEFIVCVRVLENDFI
jgi:hypothetical protein